MAEQEQTLNELHVQTRKLQELLYYFESQEQIAAEDYDYAYRTLETVIQRLKQVRKSSSWGKRNTGSLSLSFNPRYWLN